MPQIHGTDESTGLPDILLSRSGSLNLRLREIPEPVDVRIARFDAAADMPADITNLANVAADRVKFDTFASTARRIQLLWHEGTNSANATALAGPIATGARVSINAGDDAVANTRLQFVDLTGGGTSSTGKLDVIQLSRANPFVELILSGEILRIDAIGIPIGVTPTNIIPSFLEVRVIG